MKEEGNALPTGSAEVTCYAVSEGPHATAAEAT